MSTKERLMTRKDNGNLDTGVTYQTVNLFSSDKRFIDFISDVSHLVKAARNCLYNSVKERYTQYMCKNGVFQSINHISDIFYEDRECGLNILPKPLNEHIKLTRSSKMKVKLSAGVLSSAVCKVVFGNGSPKAANMTHFCSLMHFFWHYQHSKYLVSWIWTKTNNSAIHLCQ